LTEAVGKRVLLAGATGYIGQHVLKDLLQRGYEVTAAGRNISNRADLKVVTADLTDPHALDGLFPPGSFDAVISCIASRTGVARDAWAVDYEANRNLLSAGIKAGATHFVLLSAICVQRPRLAFQQAKLAFEAQLARSGIDYSIVRPTAYFKSLAGQVKRVLEGKPFLLFGDGRLTACKPISERDLSEFIVDCLVDDSRQNQILPIGGPGEAITPRKQGEWLFELTGITPKFRSVPPAMLSVAAALTKPLGLLIPAMAEKSELARIGHYYATESMLCWDEEMARYDANATPSTGHETLQQFYQRVLSEGLQGQEAGKHKLF